MEVDAWLADGVHRYRREGAGVHLMMAERSSGELVGSISLFKTDWEARSSEVGYGVRPDRRGRGYASEAAAAVARWALAEGGMQRIQLTAVTENLPSLRVAEKAGFQREGTLRRAQLEDDGLHGPTVLLRAELDALPIREDTGVDYASTATAKAADGHEVPVDHACGHDMHMACLLGMAKLMADHPGQWNGTLIPLFKPAEETRWPGSQNYAERTWPQPTCRCTPQPVTSA